MKGRGQGIAFSCHPNHHQNEVFCKTSFKMMRWKPQEWIKHFWESAHISCTINTSSRNDVPFSAWSNNYLPSEEVCLPQEPWFWLFSIWERGNGRAMLGVKMWERQPTLVGNLCKKARPEQSRHARHPPPLQDCRLELAAFDLFIDSFLIAHQQTLESDGIGQCFST